MSEKNPYLYELSSGQEVFRMGGVDAIPSPVYIPEMKGAEGLHALLDHINALDEKNPIMVPAAKWSWLREKNGITNRTNDTGEKIGKEEIEELEEGHPLIFYDPPELYNYRLTKTLVNYLFKHGAWHKEKFEKLLRNELYSDALAELPELAQPFVHANFNRVLEETDGAAQISSAAKDINSPEEAWTSLEPRNYRDYYQVLATQAEERPNAVLVPPVPQMSREWNDELVTAWCTSNSQMAEQAIGRENCDAYFHLYLNHQALDSDASNDTASKSLRVLEGELENHDYAGIAVTVHKPNNIWQTNKAARMETFMNRLSAIGDEHALPIICPRSEWFGSYVTDLGVQAFSSLLNGAWQYSRYSSGGPKGADKYGSTMIPNEARALKLQSDMREDLEGYLEAHGELPEVDGLPSEPPTYDPTASGLQEKFGTSPEFRQTFGKPRRLAHVAEAQEFREKRAEGVSNPAKEYLKESKNPYVEL